MILELSLFRVVKLLMNGRICKEKKGASTAGFITGTIH